MDLVNVVIMVGTKDMIPDTELSSEPGVRYESTKFAVDLETKIVYWKFCENETASNNIIMFDDNHKNYNHKVGYMCQYLGQHGRPCKLSNGKFVEISAKEFFED